MTAPNTPPPAPTEPGRVLDLSTAAFELRVIAEADLLDAEATSARGGPGARTMSRASRKRAALLTALADALPALLAEAEAGRAASRWRALWKQRAKRHRELHKGYESAANHFASEAREMAVLAARNADLADKAIAERDALAAEMVRVRAENATLGDAVLDLVNQYAYHEPDGSYYAGGLSTLEASFDVLVDVFGYERINSQRVRAALAARTPAPGGA